MSHIALYRKWRPQRFSEIVGQKQITQTLQNALVEDRFSHAYLFSGPRGTGKTSAAKLLAKAVNCAEGPAAEPCNQCSICKRITDGIVVDVVEIDAASNRGVDEIRDIRDNVKYAPTEVRMKVYIIDEVHMLTTEAFNALLKTLEEPPSHVMFILATTEPHRLPTTILSRCQKFDFRRVPQQEQMQRLQWVCQQEEIQAEEKALQHISRLSDGGMRDALSLLDQVVAYSGNHVSSEDVLVMTGGIASEHFEKLALMIQRKDMGAALEWIDTQMQEGKNADRGMESLIHYFRDMLLIKMASNSKSIAERISDSDRLKEISKQFDERIIFDMIEILNHFQVEMKYSTQPQTLFEVAVMKLCHLTEEYVATTAEGISEKDHSTSFVDHQIIDELQRKTEKLEQQVQQLLQTNAKEELKAETSIERKKQSGTRPRSTVSSLQKIKLDVFISGKEGELFQKIVMNWNQVLNEVKEQKITVHAWLVDGEPVSVAEDGTVLVSFKSSMHRDTTERPANKQLIEQVMEHVYGKSLKISTIMQNDWMEGQKSLQNAEGKSSAKQEQTEENTLSSNEKWIDEAISFFGEDLITIKEKS